MRSAAACALLLALAPLPSCSNSPYPSADDAVAVRYRALANVPKSLDPAVSYSVAEHQILVNVYETLLEYHYLLRPYTLVPGLARDLPEPRTLPDGRVAYRFELRPGMLFQADPAFGAFGEPGRRTRGVTAADVAFQLTRHADPEIGSQVVETFAKIEGFRAFGARLEALRRDDPAAASLRIDRLYARAGGIAGIRVLSPHELEVVLAAPYPQFVYWFAMPFTAPVPWEAVAHYDGQAGRPFFKDHPVGAGPFRVARYDQRSRIVLERNPNWYGVRHPEWRAPGAVYPAVGETADARAGRLDPAYVGRPLPFIDRIDYRVENETIPYFNKFLQGYYDHSGIPEESFAQLVHEAALSPAMEERGIQLDTAVDLNLFYVGFNMNDPVVGGERGRPLRQALSLATDAREFLRLFANGRGVPAQSPLPPGLWGYDPRYRNPYRQPDLERARALLAEAGYPDGIDPATGRPLRLSLDVGDASTRLRLRYSFFTSQWNRLGIDARLDATHYNQFREKIRKGAYQIFFWGWHADYPDPENFLFLLYGPIGQAVSGGVNTANFAHPRYDELFAAMKDEPNGPRRHGMIREMRAILERERPWIELYHREEYKLFQPWLRNVKTAGLVYAEEKYVDLDPARRAALRAAWNQPIRWPAWALLAGGVVLVVPGIVTYFRERQ